MTILIVVPTLNAGEALSTLVRSLQAQTSSAWRVLLVDGPSRPEEREQLEDLCQSDGRFRWQAQKTPAGGIYGAMNEGFAAARADDWLLFWGADDAASDPNVIHKLLTAIERRTNAGAAPDLLIFQARYVDAKSGRAGRRSRFRRLGAFRLSMALGSVPPHQGLLIGPGARQRCGHYDTSYRLAADLRYGLELSRWPELRLAWLDQPLVVLGDGGISGRQTRLRLTEVRRAYSEAFGLWWWLPFGLRYLQRGLSLLERR